MSGSNDSKPSSVIVAVATDTDPDATNPARSVALARALAAALAVDVSSAHVDEPDDVDEPGHTERLAEAIASSLPTDGLLVIDSEHADRWRSRYSVAEHVIDAFAGPAVAIGPNATATLGAGPVIVALDGSTPAEASLATAEVMAKALGRDLALVSVVEDPLHASGDEAATSARSYLDDVAGRLGGNVATTVVSSNDPVSAIVALAADNSCALVALASRGDRSTKRSSMSRTASGLIAEAASPVLIVDA